MNISYRYLDRILGGWRIPAFALLVVATHLLVEALVYAYSTRFTLFLISSLVLPLVVGAIMGGRKVLWGAAINGACLIFSFSAFTTARGWRAVEGDLTEFLLVLAFSVVCGACAGGFHDRLSRRFGRTAQ